MEGFPDPSSAVTVIVTGTPVMAVAGPVITSCEVPDRSPTRTRNVPVPTPVSSSITRTVTANAPAPA